MQMKIINEVPIIERRGGRHMSLNSIKLIDTLNNLPKGKVLEITEYSSHGLRSNLINWIEKRYIKDEFMIRTKGNASYIWRVKDGT